MKLSDSLKTLLVLASLGTTAIASIQKVERGLRHYEWAGPYVLEHVRGVMEEIPHMQASARDFLWRHWREHRRGFLIVISSSTEGLPTAMKYFVEPDKDGRWIISVEGRSEQMLMRPHSTARSYSEDDWTARSVERKRAMPDGTISDKILGVDETADPQTYS